MSGNCLGNKGVVTVLRGASLGKNLKKLALADNQFNEEEKVLETMKFCMRKNKKLAKYDFKFNSFTDDGLRNLTDFLKEEGGANSHVHEIEVPERIDEKIVMDEFKAALTANKNSGKKKGKKKAGKKKKKSG